MTEKIHQRKSAGRELKLRLLRHVRQARESIRKLKLEPEAALHDLRVGMKKTRSLLRLVEDSFYPRKRRQFALRIQSVKNALELQRENAILLKMLKKLEVEPAITEQLFSQKETSAIYSDKEIENLLHETDALQQDLRALDLKAYPVKDLCGTFRGTMKKIARAMRHCRKKPNGENIHEWRKRVKDAWYQNEALHKRGRGKKFNTQTSDLSDLLGDSHDLSILEIRLKAEKMPKKKKLLSHIREEQKILHKKAFQLGKKILQ